MKKLTSILLLGALGVCSALAIAMATKYVFSNGGCDLRARIVNTRLLSTGKSPYFYKWQIKDGQFYLDPNDDYAKRTNGNVVTPAVMDILYPLALAPYRDIRIIWAILEFFLSLFAILLVLSNFKWSKSWLAWLYLIAGIIWSEFWVFEIERGQMYLLYVFLFSLSYFFYNKDWKYGHLISGCVAGLFVFLRPFALILALPFLLKTKFNWLSGWCLGIVLGLLLFVAPGYSVWNDYLHAMNAYQNNTTNEPTLEVALRTPPQPSVIEGMNDLKTIMLPQNHALLPLKNYGEMLGIVFNQTQSFLVYGIIVCVLSFLFYKQNRRLNDTSIIFLFAFLLYILAELFSVFPRGYYNLVQWIFPIGILCTRYFQRKSALVLMGIGLLLLHNFPFAFHGQSPIGELLLLSSISIPIFFPDKIVPSYIHC
jgi:Glycosyltransferase family 87